MRVKIIEDIKDLLTYGNISYGLNPFFENVKDVDIDDLISDFSKNEQTENTLTFDEKVDDILA